MAEYTRKQVLDEAKHLANMMANMEEIDRFKEVEAKLNSNQKVQQMIKRIKALQKQAVNFQAYEKTEALQKVEAEIDRLQTELDEIPVVKEFKDIQLLVNDVLQLVSGTIAREVTNHVIRSTGGDLLSGETGSKVANSTACSFK
ncbi:Polar-amino-acid-transporting ATPase [Lentibacillus sp. JNUCC-1]|uniref:RicAFT regulatory complex protein RicA family protein n=1 Tax=Lentibacillus sp. JNUCC-1 TaxID=2654513 RepID=UPI0012E7783C|nr:YlbF family regulator [Lentibacillus sp. JNUCC-1]MUV39885.1 Polar-amino-acid-transporting ATPase [Lentibacillus sp. JNUCC-1]